MTDQIDPATVAVDGDPQGCRPPASPCGAATVAVDGDPEVADRPHRPAVRQRSPWTAIPEVADRPHRPAVRAWSPPTAIPKVAYRPRTAVRVGIAGRRCFLVLLAFGVAIEAWALFPSTVESGSYVPTPEVSAPSAAEVNSAREGVVGNPLESSRANAFTLMAAKLASSAPTSYGLATVGYSVDVSLVPLRSKLQALLMMLYSQSGDVDPAALKAKLEALLQLPDSVLAQLMEHPDLAALNNMLDAVFRGESDLPALKTELDKIDVTSTSVPGTSDKIQVVNVNGEPTYAVRSPAVSTETDLSAVSLMSAPPPPPGEPVTMAFQFEAPAGLTAFDFTPAPSSEELSPPPPPTDQIASAFTLAPSSEELTPPPAPTGTPQTSLDDLDSGNKFEPGETVTDNSPATNSPATETAAPSTTAPGGEGPAEAGGETHGGDETAPSNDESGDTSAGGGTSP